MNKRIVINDYSCKANGGDCFRIAINTRQGTILESIVELKNKVQVVALVTGYLSIYHAIEIHPGSIDTWNELTAFANLKASL
jgi:hypothetical protein